VAVSGHQHAILVTDDQLSLLRLPNL